MNVKVTLKGFSLLFHAYSILVTAYILGIKLLINKPLEPIEYSGLIGVAIALFADMVMNIFYSEK